VLIPASRQGKQRPETMQMQDQHPVKTNNATKATVPGLRARQKIARTERILAGANHLFNTLGFEQTTMAAIAQSAEVSTPTVFNYFKTKEELLLALVLQVHLETREQVLAFRPKARSGALDSICDFLAMYTQKSLQSINRKTWRHVESTRIRIPESDFVKHYDALSDEMLNDFEGFLERLFEAQVKAPRVIAKVMFNHWSALFMELIRDETMTVESHEKQLREDLAALMEALNSAR